MQHFSKALRDPDERKESIIDRIQSWWWDVTRNTWYERKIVFPYKDFKAGIRNLIKWFPIVWRDRDWDDAYILKVLKFKLANTRDRIIKNNIIIKEDQNEIKRDINICIRLIDSFIDETYSMEYIDFIKREMQLVDYVSDDPDFPVEEGSKQLTFKVLENNLTKYFEKYPRDYARTIQWIAKNRPDRSSDDDEYVALMMANLRQKKADSLLWKIIDDRIKRWWD